MNAVDWDVDDDGGLVGSCSGYRIEIGRLSHDRKPEHDRGWLWYVLDSGMVRRASGRSQTVNEAQTDALRFIRTGGA